MSSFPPWLDPATLAWAAEYCEAMAQRLPARVEPATAALVCAVGLRQAIENSAPQPPPARPRLVYTIAEAYALLRLSEPADQP